MTETLDESQSLMDQAATRYTVAGEELDSGLLRAEEILRATGHYAAHRGTEATMASGRQASLDVLPPLNGEDFSRLRRLVPNLGFAARQGAEDL